MAAPRTGPPRRGLAGLLTAAVPAADPVPGRPARARTREAARARTVLARLEAFRRGDWPAAHGSASAGIRARFGLPAFRGMVRRRHPALARPRPSRPLRVRAPGARHGVRVEGNDATVVGALSEPVEEEGGWRVDGVLARPPVRGPAAARDGARGAPA